MFLKYISFYLLYNVIAGDNYMNVIDLMDSRKTSFSKNDRKIYEAIKKFPGEYASLPISEIASSGGFSKPALTRFAQKLGFGGFAEFQYQFAQDIKELSKDPGRQNNADVYGKLLKQVYETTDRDVVKNLVRKMKESRRVLLFGANLSRLPAEEMLIALNFEKDIIAQLPASDFIPYHIHSDDMVIVYSAISGSSHQELMRKFRSEETDKPYLVLITINSKHPLRHNFDEVITLPSVSLSETANTVLSDTFAFLMFNDIVAQVLKEDEKTDSPGTGSDD